VGVAKELAEKFNKLSDSGENDYLKRKGVDAHGLHFFNNGSISIPARDIDELSICHARSCLHHYRCSFCTSP
jgi:hypothetical protein